ncbi:MAG: hypothetical protein Q7S28_01545 [bacterium]|nr:hypothetical protein [bacterium]
MKTIQRELEELLKDVIVHKPKIKKRLVEHFGKSLKIYKMANGTARPSPDLARLIIAEIKRLQGD